MKERPYVRYVREAEKEILTFGRNNPTFASSQAEGRASGQGADGNSSTYWQAAADDPSPWWMSDTEKGLLLRRIKVTFPRAATYRYRIEVSSDKEHWQKVAENSPSPEDRERSGGGVSRRDADCQSAFRASEFQGQH